MRIQAGLTVFLSAVLATTLTSRVLAQAGETASKTVERLPKEGPVAHVLANRAPLAPEAAIKYPLGTIALKSWLRTTVIDMSLKGMASDLPRFSAFVRPENNAWLSPTGEGENGWEEVPYWIRATARLTGVSRNDKAFFPARKFIDAQLASQRDDGWFGPESNRSGTRLDEAKGPDLWPNTLFVRALQSLHERAEDKRIIDFLLRFFRWQAALPDDQLLTASWQHVRGGDNLEAILWLYNRTGEAWLIDLAKRVHARTAKWESGVANWHGVNIAECFDEPALYSLVSGDPALAAASDRIYDEVMTKYGSVPGGMFAAAENCREGHADPRQASEACAMAEMIDSCMTMLRVTGDPKWADRAEDVAFNSMLAALTPDAKGLRYLTAPNMPQSDRASKSPGWENSGPMAAFDPYDHRCCQHNHALGLAALAENVFLATRDGGIAVASYVAGEVRTVTPTGQNVGLLSDGNYPFSDTITFRARVPRDGSVHLPVYFRIPSWCDNAEVTVNGIPLREKPRAGTWFRLDQTWFFRDEVKLRLPMNIRVHRWQPPAGVEAGVSVRRGPLWYSLKIDERIETFGADPEFPGVELFPASAWNYALVLDGGSPESSMVFLERTHGFPANPWDPQRTPGTIEANARLIPAWTLDPTGLVNPLGPSPVRTDSPVTRVTLIPMGAARLRISVFPWTTGEGSDQSASHDWAVPK